MSHQDDRFHTTRWSVVLRARDGSDDAREALADLCDTYWFPLYAFVRRRGFDADEALDLTQGYFADLIDREYLKQVRRERGEFRSFLLVSMKHHISHVKRAERAHKRGGTYRHVSMDAADAEQRYAEPALDGRSPEELFELHWARTVVQQAQQRLREEMESEGSGKTYRLLEPALVDAEPSRPYAEIAKELGTTEASIKMGVRRLRLRFGRVLRDVVGDTVPVPDGVDAEVRHLLRVLQDHA